MRPDDSDAIQPETISSKIEKKLNLEYQTTGISQAAALFYQTHQHFKAFTLNAMPIKKYPDENLTGAAIQLHSIT